MPTYVYRRDDGTTFETQQKITEDALDRCPDTGQPVERIIAGSPGIIDDAHSVSRPSPTKSDADVPSCTGPLCGL